MDDNYALLCTESASSEPPQTRILQADDDDDVGFLNSGTNTVTTTTTTVTPISSATQAISTVHNNKQQFEIYLKKHGLDVTLLPNKKIKLSDLTATTRSLHNGSSTIQSFIFTDDDDDNDPRAKCDPNGDFGVDNGTLDHALNALANETNDPANELYENVDEDDTNEKIDKFLNDHCQFVDVEYQDDDDEDDEDEEDDEVRKIFEMKRKEARSRQKIFFFFSTRFKIDDDDDDEDEEDDEDDDNDDVYEDNDDEEDGQGHDETSQKKKKIKMRKKREPSLKLIQKLNVDDLQLIVNSIRANEAHVCSADIKKDQYIDKILKVKLFNQTQSLSNGQNEALLKKSMFPKDLNLLFDSFVKALFREQYIYEDNLQKQGLFCQVIDCGFYSFSEAEIVRHIKRHLAQDGYTCDQCGNQFASMTNLQRHLRIHNGDFGKEVKCLHCDYKASTSTHVNRHMAHKHLERSLPCPHCSFMGATNAELKIHMARKHLELTGKNPLYLPKYLKKDYQCSVCNKKYTDYKEYQTHIYEHSSSINRFQCNVCPYNCKNFSKLKRHMLYHSGSRNYECLTCGNKFFQMEHLKRHMHSIHQQELLTGPTANMSPMSTSASASSTPTDSPVKASRTRSITRQTHEPSSHHTRQVEISHHIQQHQQQCYKVTSKCMYKCQQCDYTTIKLYTLNEHVIYEHLNHDHVNGAGSPLACSFCTYTTNKKTNLKRHLHNNHSSQSTAPILLSNDALMIHPNTRFQCGICRRYLSNINDFVKHITEKHKMQVFILDSNNENTIQEQLQTRGRAELICTTNTTTNSNSTTHDDSLCTKLDDFPTSSKDMINQVIIIQEDKQQQQRLLPMSTHQHHHHHQNIQSTSGNTVRINPALNDLLQKQRKQQRQQTLDSSSTSSSQYLTTYTSALSPQMIESNSDDQAIHDANGKHLHLMY